MEQPVERQFVFKLITGETLYGMYVGEWLKDPEDEKMSFRYCLVAKKLIKSSDLHYILLNQVKGLQTCFTIDEGKIPMFKFKSFWADFEKAYKEQFNTEYRSTYHDFDSMVDTQRNNLFNAIIATEIGGPDDGRATED